MKRGLIIAGGVIGAALLIALVVVSEIESVPRNETIRNVSIMLAGLAGLSLGYWRSVIADEQRALRERGLITDRFNKGVENLDSEKQAVRIGGVYTLWRLIEEIPSQDKIQQKSDVKMIVETLIAFVCGYEHEANEEESNDYKMPKDLENVVQLLGQADAPYRSIMPHVYKINLEGANLRHGNFPCIDLSNALAPHVDLSGAVLTTANLPGAFMLEAKFNNARLEVADCRSVFFTGADFESAFLALSNFEKANFSGAQIVDTNFYRANLKNAMFSSASFSRKNPAGEIITSKGVSLEDADITGADFTYAKGLTQGKIDQAVCDQNNPPKLPDGLKPPTRTPEDVEKN